MRTNLRVPYGSKDQAKALGAKWDAALKVWYIVDVEDLTLFMPWLARKQFYSNGRKEVPGQKRALYKSGVMTYSTVQVSHCGCNHVPAWEHCEHSEAAESAAQAEMLA